MALSKSSRIIILLVIDSCFFLLELVTGYSVHSLALVADSFHMLNDVLSLCVGLWAVKMANKSSAPKMYTYGYQRAETLGALVNGVFLVALCVTIFLDAIQRFVEPQEVSNPQLVLIVGCLGLASNLVGLVLFHDHGHSHGGGGHGHDHGNGNAVKDAEEGHAHDHSGHSHSHAAPATADEHNHNHAERTSSESTAVKRRHSRSHSKSYVNYEDFPGPAGFRNSIIAHGRLEALDSAEGTDGEASPAENGNVTTEADPLIIASHAGYGSVPRKSIDHAEHNHSKPREAGSGGGHGHSHGDLNMKGIFLHVMGDALGNIGVIATALIIWLTKFPGRFYFDPAISLVITIIILCSAIPLCKAASRILLQAVPHGIEVDDIRDDIQDLPGIESCHHLHVWQLSDTKLVASLHVRVNFNFRAEGSQRYMQLASAIRQCLHEYGIHSSTIQPEFHRGSEYEGDDGHRNAPAPGDGGDEQDCLLDCGDGCGDGGKSCCPPPPRNGSEASSAGGHEGHRH